MAKKMRKPVAESLAKALEGWTIQQVNYFGKGRVEFKVTNGSTQKSVVCVIADHTLLLQSDTVTFEIDDGI